MAWLPKEKEVEAMLGADGKKRYEYFIHRVCDTRKVWGLHDGGWASLGDGDKKWIPFWPHEIYASRFRTADWSSYVPKEIELGAFLDRWLPGMRADGVAAAIFPVGPGSSVLVSLDDLEANLRHELSNSYEEEG
ncbi:MAG: DUF2750 domain-containing protein [Opitutae bacterium]|nr:DUF2750 domain-containing protein [Opitutae bacterium]